MAYKMPHHRTLSKSNLCELAICSCKTALILKAENGRKKKKKSKYIWGTKFFNVIFS